MQSQVISKHRVSEHGEVLTGAREVNAMLELVKHEAERIESRFFEPACGNGNFLAEILARKLAMVEKRYASSQLSYERYAVLAATSIYGVDILEDNVQYCRIRLHAVFGEAYFRLFGQKCQAACSHAVKFIFERNIVWGDALTLMTVGEKPRNIVFSEWSPINGSMLKRRDFTFHALLSHEEGMKDMPLFSDRGEDVFIPTPEKEYPPTHFMEISNAR